MSLEQALIENTAALKLMTLALNYCPQDVKDALLDEIKSATVGEIEQHLDIKPSAKAKKDKALVEESEAVETEEPLPAAKKVNEAEQPEAEVTYESTAEAVTQLARTKGREIAVGILSKFGASKLPDAKPKDFAAIIAACEKALEAA
jgi:hypothetical protein